MWKRGCPFDEVLTSVKAIRGVANPNIGFTCQVSHTLKLKLLLHPCLLWCYKAKLSALCNHNCKFIEDEALLQLLNWQRRRGKGDKALSMYRIAPQCVVAPLYLVAKPVPTPSFASLDPRGAFILHHAEHIIIWQARLMNAHLFALNQV